MDLLDNHLLISIFKYLNFAARLQASKTCRLWRTLLQDSETLVDDINEVHLDGTNFPEENHQEEKEWSGSDALIAIISHIRRSDHLILPDKAGRVLLEEPIKQRLSRFGNIRINWNNEFDGDRLRECLRWSPTSVNSLSISVFFTTSIFFDFSGMDHLERLEIDHQRGIVPQIIIYPRYRYPSSLRALAINSPPFRNFMIPFPRLALDRPYLYGIHFEEWPVLEELKIGGFSFDNDLFKMLCQPFPNLRRIHFCNNTFSFHSKPENGSDRRPPIEWIKFENCVFLWYIAAECLIESSNVKTVVIVLNKKPFNQELKKINQLAPLMTAKNATLELTIEEPRGQLVAPLEFCHLLTKLELISVNSGFAKSTLVGNSFEKLKELTLHTCEGLDDSDLAMVAKWCLNLEIFSFEPAAMHDFTDQCLLPFLNFWDNRESKQLSIECLQTGLAFGWFNSRLDDEKGVLEDGKRWARFLNSELVGKKEDGSIEVGTRMVIWDPNGKRLVIRDYEKNFVKKLMINMGNEGCRVKEVEILI